MAINVGNLMATLDMNTAGFRKGVAESRTGVEKMKSRFAGLKTTALAGAATIGVAFAAIGTAAVASADSIDKAMATIRVGTGATGDDLAKMGDNLRNVLKQVPSDAGTVGTAIADLNTRLGLTGDELEDTALKFVELSRITGTDVGTNIKTVTRLFGDFSVATEDQADALDYLFKVSQATGATVDTLASKATTYGTSLRGMGFDMETSVALLGKFEKEGVNTETILASLKIGMSNMAREGITDANEALTLLMGEIKNAPTDLAGTQKAIDIFGSRAGPDMAMAIREGRFEINDLIDSVDSSSETILQAAEDSKTLGDRFGILKNKISVAIEPLGEMIIGALEGVINWISTDGAAMFEPIMQAFAAVGVWWTSSGQEIIGAIVDGFGWLREAFQPFVDMFLDFWGNQAQKMTEFWETDGAVIMAALENIRAAFQIIIEYIAKGWEWLWPHLENILGPAIDILLDIIGVFAAIFAGDWDKLGERLGMISLHTMDLLYGIISLGFDSIVGLFAAIANGIVGIMAAAWNAILSGMEGMINTATGLLNGLIIEINRIPGVNVGLIGQVTFERAEAPKVELPTMADLFGGKKPSEIWGPSREFEPEPAAEEEMALETSPISARDKAPEKPAAVAIEIPEPPAAEAPVPVEIPEPPVIEPPAPVEIPEPLAAEAPLPVEIPEFPPIPEGISESAFSELIAAIKSFSITPIVDAIVNARDMVLAAMGYEIVIPAVPGQVTNNKETVISEVLPEAPAEEEAIVPDIQTRTKPGEGATKPAGSIVETIRSVGDSVIAAIKSSSKTPDLDSSAYRNTTNFPEVTKSLKNLRTELITVTTPPPPQVTPTPAVTRTEEASQDLHITTEIDGYAVGQAIYRNWTQRTGGGVNI